MASMDSELTTEEVNAFRHDLRGYMLHYSEVNVQVHVENLSDTLDSDYLKVEASVCDRNWMSIGLIEDSRMLIRRRTTQLQSGQVVEDMELTLISYLVSLLQYRHGLRFVSAYLADTPSEGIFRMKVEIGSKFSYGMSFRHDLGTTCLRFMSLD